MVLFSYTITYGYIICIGQKKSLLMTPIFSKLMRRGRFEYIRKMLHFVDSLGLDHYIVTCKLEAFHEILRTLHSLELYTSQSNK